MKKVRAFLAIVLALSMMLTLAFSFSTSAAVTAKKVFDQQALAAYWGGNIEVYGTDGLGLQGSLPIPADGWGYIYLNLHQFIDETPYLVYNCEVCDGGWNCLCPAGLLDPTDEVWLVVDGADHVFDLRTIDTENLFFCVTYFESMKFDKLYLTSDASGAYSDGGEQEQPQGGEEPQTGAETLVIPCVALLATSAVAIVVSKKRK